MTDYLEKILSLGQALEKRAILAAEGRRLVFTNGCFDLLHPGHLRYLAQARSLGDFLMVGLNSDASVERLKGPARPVRDQGERSELLAALVMVDGLTIFDEDTPLGLITALRPDFLVKGGDWAVDDIVGAREVRALGGQVMSLALTPGFSSSSLIARIARTCGGGRR
ncbi:MAG: D-glycero-beta-D-manno-heptose 1-phosphate adenylyltransferase [Deltaproteobacteria bacterium]|jgi:rfaE bifunctional protein nucleotidyltransferase chain/domain|nr:D-glycero-beta-D-manno-heptose 1-phosphate adenylyltransferase [Deltaproteobacteria bacterium]